MHWLAVAYLQPSEYDTQNISQKRKDRLTKIFETKGHIGFMIEYLTQKVVAQQKYIHCELVFVDPNNLKCTAFAVFAETGLTKQERKFQQDAYKWVFIKCERPIVKKLFNWCLTQVGAPFDEAGLRRLGYWPRKKLIKKNGKIHSWCSSFVLTCLQKIGYFPDQNPASLDVEDVIDLILKNPRIIQKGLLAEAQLNKLEFGESSGVFGNAILSV
jgi:hypothetical protein